MSGRLPVTSRHPRGCVGSRTAWGLLCRQSRGTHVHACRIKPPCHGHCPAGLDPLRRHSGAVRSCGSNILPLIQRKTTLEQIKQEPRPRGGRRHRVSCCRRRDVSAILSQAEAPHADQRVNTNTPLGGHLNIHPTSCCVWPLAKEGTDVCTRQKDNELNSNLLFCRTGEVIREMAAPASDIL